MVRADFPTPPSPTTTSLKVGSLSEGGLDILQACLSPPLLPFPPLLCPLSWPSLLLLLLPLESVAAPLLVVLSASGSCFSLFGLVDSSEICLLSTSALSGVSSVFWAFSSIASVVFSSLYFIAF